MRLVLAVSVLAVWLLALSPLTGSASRAADALAYRFTSIEGEPVRIATMSSPSTDAE